MTDSLAPVKKITQDTFDEVVTENIVEFELSKDEAILDAWKQFSSQGVDLTDIDLSGGVGKQEVLEAIALITPRKTSTAVADKEYSYDEVVINLDILKALCSHEHEMSKRNLVIMRTKGGLDALHSLLFPSQNATILVKSLTLLELVSTNSGTPEYSFLTSLTFLLMGIMVLHDWRLDDVLLIQN